MTDLTGLLRKAKERVDAMTAVEIEAMLKEQAAAFARSEMSWPAPRFHWENGVKVYESYEDYCND